MAEKIYDLVVIGAGPAGYVGAIRASQLGMNVAVVESRPTLGGVCLNEGCIPSKALLDSSEHFAQARDNFALHGIDIPAPKLNLSRMMERKDAVVTNLTTGVGFLFKKNKITWIKGYGFLSGKNSEGVQQVEVSVDGSVIHLKSHKILLATGSCSAQIPDLPVDGEFVLDNVGALSLLKVPDHLVVIGGGYIGLELGSVWLRLGAKVSIVEMLPGILPKSDHEISKTLQRALKKQGMTFYLGTQVDDVQKNGKGMTLTLSKGGKQQEISCDKILVSIGRKPNSTGFGVSELGIKTDQYGRVLVDSHYTTSVTGIYAVGDLIPGPMLAHKASEEAIACVEGMLYKSTEVDYNCIPGICYTWPEMASVGQTEEQLVADGIPFKVGKFNFLGNGRAHAMAETEGLVKVLSHAESGRLLGLHILGPRASDLIVEGIAVMHYRGTAEDIGTMVHGHPTLSEAVKEAALDTGGGAIHS